MLCTEIFRNKMIMEGLDTLSQVALADLSFDTYNPPQVAGLGGRHDSVADDNLNTPINKNAGVDFNFGPSQIDISQEALPITGEFIEFIV